MSEERCTSAGTVAIIGIIAVAYLFALIGAGVVGGMIFLLLAGVLP